EAGHSIKGSLLHSPPGKRRREWVGLVAGRRAARPTRSSADAQRGRPSLRGRGGLQERRRAAQPPLLRTLTMMLPALV
ncbi:MAG: hypothetical protein L3J91_04235, partial [Thermoplasmata archaeon]|nr:hypothetical protein [Thermoplasmata archaeon]